MPVKKVEGVKSDKCEQCCKKGNVGGGSGGGAVYGIGIFGAAFYFFPQAVGISGFFLAIFKTLAWPALLVYQALSMLKM